MKGEFITDNIKDRLLKRNQNWLAVICGGTGSGKSYSALRLAESLDASFNIDRVVFGSGEFMELINSGKLQAGNVIIYDEAGVGIPAREFATLSNRLLMYVAQTFRHRNLGVIFTVPSFSFIDVQARRLLHAYIETLSINRHENVCITKFMNIQVNPRINDKVYYKYPRFVDEAGKIKVIERFRIAKPSKELIKAYELKRCGFTDRLNRSVEAQLKHSQEKTNAQEWNADEVADRLMQDLDSIMVSSGNHKELRISPELIMNSEGVGRQKAAIVRRIIEQRIKKADIANTHGAPIPLTIKGGESDGKS